MAGTNGPTSVAGTVDTPNPEGGPVKDPDTGDKGAKPKEKDEHATSDEPAKHG